MMGGGTRVLELEGGHYVEWGGEGVIVLEQLDLLAVDRGGGCEFDKQLTRHTISEAERYRIHIHLQTTTPLCPFLIRL